MKKCPYCAEEIQDEAVVCRYCGRDIPKVVGVTPAVFVPEISTPAKLKPNNPKRKRAILFAIGGIIFLCVICIASVLIIGSTPQARESATKRAQTETAAPTKTKTSTKTLVPTRTFTPTNTATETTTPAIDSSVKAIMAGASLSQQDAEAAFEVLKSVGLNDVDQLTPAGDGYRVSGNCVWLVCHSICSVLFTDNKVTYVGWGEIVLYDKDQGGVLDNIANYTLTEDKKIDFQVATEFQVESVLKAPSTAKYVHDKWVITRNKDIVEVWGSVDAENSFGAMLRNDFYAQWSYSTDNLLYLQVAGNVVYGSIQKP